MSDNELTITKVLQDSMIRLMMRADGVSLKAMKILLADATLAQRARGEHPHVGGSISDQKHFGQSRRGMNAAAQPRI